MKLMQASKGRVLFVNNDIGADESITPILKDLGYQTSIAHSIRTGMKLVNEERFDIFLIGWVFEDGTGIDLCRSIRLVDEQTPIFFYRAEPQAFELKKAMQAGAQGCFLRPADIHSSLKALSH